MNKIYVKNLVSVGIPMFNAEQYIMESLQSLLNQTYTNIEIIVCDDSSTDSSLSIVENIAKTDKRVKIFKNDKNLGLVGNFNHTMSLATGEFYMWGDQDDLWDPKFVEKCIDKLKENSSIILAATKGHSFIKDEQGHNLILFTDPGITTRNQSPSQRFKTYQRALHNNLCIGTIFCGIWRTELMHSCQKLKSIVGGDVVIMSEYQLLGETATIDEPLFLKRWGGSSSNLRRLQVIVGHTNRYSKFFPFLDKELETQKVIFRSKNINIWRKAILATWSFSYFLWIYHIKYPFRNFLPEIKTMIFGKTKIQDLKKSGTLLRHILPDHIIKNIFKYLFSNKQD